MKDILFIRHAETDMSGTFCGHSNPSINDLGRAQLSDLLFSLKDEDIDEVYSSDLLRAQETGNAIAASKTIRCQLRPALREINFGRWDGLTWEEIERVDGIYAQRWLDEYPNLPASGGETLFDFERRVMREVESLISHTQGRGIAVVTHAGVIRVVLQQLFGLSREAWKQSVPYCSVHRYEVSVHGFVEYSGGRL